MGKHKYIAPVNQVLMRLLRKETYSTDIPILNTLLDTHSKSLSLLLNFREVSALYKFVCQRSFCQWVNDHSRRSGVESGFSPYCVFNTVILWRLLGWDRRVTRIQNAMGVDMGDVVDELLLRKLEFLWQAVHAANPECDNQDTLLDRSEGFGNGLDAPALALAHDRHSKQESESASEDFKDACECEWLESQEIDDVHEEVPSDKDTEGQQLIAHKPKRTPHHQTNMPHIVRYIIAMVMAVQLIILYIVDLGSLILGYLLRLLNLDILAPWRLLPITSTIFSAAAWVQNIYRRIRIRILDWGYHQNTFPPESVRPKKSKALDTSRDSKPTSSNSSTTSHTSYPRTTVDGLALHASPATTPFVVSNDQLCDSSLHSLLVASTLPATLLTCPVHSCEPVLCPREADHFCPAAISYLPSALVAEELQIFLEDMASDVEVIVSSLNDMTLPTDTFKRSLVICDETPMLPTITTSAETSADPSAEASKLPEIDSTISPHPHTTFAAILLLVFSIIYLIRKYCLPNYMRRIPHPINPHGQDALRDDEEGTIPVYPYDDQDTLQHDGEGTVPTSSGPAGQGTLQRDEEGTVPTLSEPAGQDTLQRDEEGEPEELLARSSDGDATAGFRAPPATAATSASPRSTAAALKMSIDLDSTSEPPTPETTAAVLARLERTGDNLLETWEAGLSSPSASARRLEEALDAEST